MIENMLEKMGVSAEIQQRTQISSDSFEGKKYSWTKKADITGVMFNATYISKAAKRIVSDKISEEVTHYFYILPADITSADRIKIGEKLFVILLVDPNMNANEYYTLYLKESGNNASYI